MGPFGRFLAVLICVVLALTGTALGSASAASVDPFHVDGAHDDHGPSLHGHDHSAHEEADGAGGCTLHGNDCAGCAQHCGSALSLEHQLTGLVRIDLRLARIVPDDSGPVSLGHRFERPPRAI